MVWFSIEQYLWTTPKPPQSCIFDAIEKPVTVSIGEEMIGIAKWVSPNLDPM
jgi:hypothetical protein